MTPLNVVFSVTPASRHGRPVFFCLNPARAIPRRMTQDQVEDDVKVPDCDAELAVVC